MVAFQVFIFVSSVSGTMSKKTLRLSCSPSTVSQFEVLPTVRIGKKLERNPQEISRAFLEVRSSWSDSAIDTFGRQFLSQRVVPDLDGWLPRGVLL